MLNFCTYYINFDSSILESFQKYPLPLLIITPPLSAGGRGKKNFNVDKKGGLAIFEFLGVDSFRRGGGGGV